MTERDATPQAHDAPPIRVLIVEDHPLMAEAVAKVVTDAGMTVAATLSEVTRLAAVWRSEKPDVIVCDASVRSQLDGIAAAGALLRAEPDARVLIYSGRTDRPALLAATDAGVTGYVVKTASVDDLVRAIHEVAAGRSAYDPATASAMITVLRGRRNPRISLTPREQDVLSALCLGNTSTAGLAHELGMGPETVKSHLASLAAKLNVHDRAGIVVAGYRLGLVPDRRRVARGG